MAQSRLLILLLVFSFKPLIYSQVYPVGRVDSLLKAGIRQIVNQDYSGAEVFISSLQKEYPQLPLGKIYLAAIQIAKAYDYSEKFNDSLILGYLEDAKEQSENLVEADEENIWYRYFYALAEGYIAYFDAIKGSWLSAVSTGVNSISEFETILSLDKNFYEAYIAIGTFEYWMSRKTEFMSWMPFVNDTKKIGIDRLRVAIDSSSYNSYLAVNSLIWIYIDKKDYSSAIKTAKNALLKFPESRSFKWGLARAYEETDPQGAINLYKEILKSYPFWLNSNLINEVTLKHLIAQQHIKLGQYRTALGICEEILSINDFPEHSLEVLDSRLKRIKTLADSLRENY